jgi:hypothetical protein
MSVFNPTPRIDRDEHDRLHENAGQQVLDVLTRSTSQRAAEDVREQQREHDRRHDDVEELKGDMLDLEQRPPRVRYYS